MRIKYGGGGPRQALWTQVLWLGPPYGKTHYYLHFGDTEKSTFFHIDSEAWGPLRSWAALRAPYLYGNYAPTVSDKGPAVLIPEEKYVFQRPLPKSTFDYDS